MLLVGLGNPGDKYVGTRHNIGFDIIERIISEYSFNQPVKKFGSLYSEGDIEGKKIRLLMPQTFMNLSGQAVQEAVNFYKESLSHVVVFHDELDLPLGRMKMKTGGSDGGHNGLKSIDSLVGKEYKRVRVGIGHPGDKNMVSNYVRGKFANPEKPIADDIVDVVVKNIGYLVKGSDALFATRFAEGAAKIEGLQEIGEDEVL